MKSIVLPLISSDLAWSLALLRNGKPVSRTTLSGSIRSASPGFDVDGRVMAEESGLASTILLRSGSEVGSASRSFTRAITYPHFQTD